MENARYFFKTSLFLLLTVGLAPFYLFLLLTLYPLRKRIGPRLVQFYSALCLFIFRVEIEVVGAKSSSGTRNGVIIVSNHTSFLDIFLLSRLFGCVFVSKDDVKWYPIMGQIAWLMGVIFFDRSSPKERVRVLRKISLNKSPVPVSVFPQGTTGRLTDRLPFNRGVFKVIQLNPDISLLPVTILYKDDREVAWHNPESLKENARKVFGRKKVQASVTIHKLLTSESLRRKTAEEVCREVQDTILGQLN